MEESKDLENLEDLFNEAKRLFGNTGPGSCATTAVQNPGCITTQEEVDYIRDEIYKAISKKKEDLNNWEVDAKSWWADLNWAFKNGKV
jgi:hypothetical protein